MAEYVLAHQFRVATMTIDEFAAAVGVSVATANRFARALELPGYPQFRAELARGFEAALEPVESCAPSWRIRPAPCRSSPPRWKKTSATPSATCKD